MKKYLFAAIAVFVSACQAPSGPPLEVVDVEVTSPRPGMSMSAGYFRITNNGSETVSITRVDSPQYGSVELHETEVVDGVARMRPLKVLEVPPDQTVTFERGGRHLMLMRPVDDIDTVTLNFYSGEALLLSVDTRVVESD